MKEILIKKLVNIIFLLIIAVALYMWLSVKEEQESVKQSENAQTDIGRFVRTADDVSKDMLSAKYWVDMQEAPDEVIMTQLEIDIWNEQSKVADFWEITESEQNADDTENGQNAEVATSVMYAYTVARTSIRKEPTSEFTPIISGDEYFCELQVSSILLNEPVVVLDESEDGLWYYIRCRYCEGWIEKENVALCDNFENWVANMNPKDFLLVTGDKEILEVDTKHAETSELVLYMGTRLELIEYEYYVAQGNDRVPYECYIVKVPVRDEYGYLEYEYAFVPVSRDVNVGYLPYTARNLITQMFKLNGDRYGWGGMFNARDCSQYVMEIYSLFGFEFPRNSGAQAQMNFAGYNMENATDREKMKLLDETPIGSILYFEGHVMLYLGKVDGEYYVISETARISTSDSKDNTNSKSNANEIINAHSCMITTLSTLRPNGSTWLRSLSKIVIIS